MGELFKREPEIRRLVFDYSRVGIHCGIYNGGTGKAINRINRPSAKEVDMV